MTSYAYGDLEMSISSLMCVYIYIYICACHGVYIIIQAQIPMAYMRVCLCTYIHMLFYTHIKSHKHIILASTQGPWPSRRLKGLNFATRIHHLVWNLRA